MRSSDSRSHHRLLTSTRKLQNTDTRRIGSKERRLRNRQATGRIGSGKASREVPPLQSTREDRYTVTNIRLTRSKEDARWHALHSRTLKLASPH